MQNSTAEYYIKLLNMTSHPEGGYYKEFYRSQKLIEPGNSVLKGYKGERNLATSIYFLLNGDQISAFHRLKSDELWYFHAGSPVMIYLIDKRGRLTPLKLGLNIEADEMPQVLLPKGVWFAAEVYNKESFSLFGCVVAPGFDFRDFELAEKSRLTEMFPQHETLISRMCVR